MLEQRNKPESVDKIENQVENEQNNNMIIDPGLITIFNGIQTINPGIVRQILQRTLSETPDPELESGMIRMNERMTIRRNQRANEEEINPEERLEPEQQGITEEEGNDELRNELIASIGRLILIYRIQISLETDEPDPLVEEGIEAIMSERNQRSREEQTNVVPNRKEPELE